VRVREFRREDIAQTAELWLRVFRGQARAAPQALREYFQLIFFGAPWRDEQLPSLVYEENGRVAGFLGVIPRRMRFCGEPIRAAVVSQLMVDPNARNRYAAAALARRHLASPQDLTFCDGSNDAAERVWCANGAEVAQLFNLAWFRLLRPARYFALLAREHAAAFSAALAPAWLAADALIGMGPRPLRLPECGEDGLQASPATPRAIAAGVRKLCAGRSLVPDVEPGALNWLVARAAEKSIHGRLQGALLHERDGTLAGWYLYYARRGAVAQVLHAAAHPRRARDLLHRLFRDAHASGACAVAGQIDPRHMKDYARAGCRFMWPGYTLLAASRRPELMGAIHRGDAWLTRLEGEWWARFSDPSWSEAEAEPIAKEVPACAASQAS
jgi:hypothetical protein